MWQSSTSEEAKCQSEDGINWASSENENSDFVLVKRETDDDEKEEGEIKDDEDDTLEENNTSEEDGLSPNPVNLSLNTKNSNDDKDNNDENIPEVSQ